ncbi:MAG: hypothetical protein ABIG95_01905 [Candidatus Woesearchaeota archaeon]
MPKKKVKPKNHVQDLQILLILSIVVLVLVAVTQSSLIPMEKLMITNLRTENNGSIQTLYFTAQNPTGKELTCDVIVIASEKEYIKTVTLLPGKEVMTDIQVDMPEEGATRITSRCD